MLCYKAYMFCYGLFSDLIQKRLVNSVLEEQINQQFFSRCCAEGIGSKHGSVRGEIRLIQKGHIEYAARLCYKQGPCCHIPGIEVQFKEYILTSARHISQISSGRATAPKIGASAQKHQRNFHSRPTQFLLIR